MTRIRVTSQKQILKTPIFTIREDHVQIGARTVNYYSMHRNPSIIVLPLSEKGELYLISQYRYLYKKRCLEAVAGYINKGESPLAAAKRELQEEIGLSANSWEQILKTELSAGSVKATVYIFLARDLEKGDHNRESEEDIELLTMDLSEAADKAMTGALHEAATVAGILLLDKLRREKKV